jgi:hypothetical protein
VVLVPSMIQPAFIKGQAMFTIPVLATANVTPIAKAAPTDLTPICASASAHVASPARFSSTRKRVNVRASMPLIKATTSPTPTQPRQYARPEVSQEATFGTRPAAPASVALRLNSNNAIHLKSFTLLRALATALVALLARSC